VRKRRRTFVDDDGRTGCQRPVGDVAVAGDPPDVGCTPEDIVAVQVENPFAGELGAE
jgi:hypothetical protein